MIYDRASFNKLAAVIAGPDGKAVGIRFTDPNRGATFDGRYTPELP